MILLIDTITYNCFSDYINDENTAKIPKNMKIKELSQLLTDKKNQVWLHSATMFELLIKCYNNSNQKDYKENGKLNLGQFADDYQFIIKNNGFHIMNEKQYKFEWEKIVSYYNDNADLNINEFVNKKIEMEREFIFNFISLLALSCNKKMNSTKEYMSKCLIKNFIEKISINNIIKNIKREIESILKQHYFGNIKPKEVTQKIDAVLYFFLETTIKQNYNTKIKQDGKGAEYAKEFFKNSDVKKYIMMALDDLEGYMNLTKTSKIYLSKLMEDTLTKGAKITKNDASDYYILTAGDLLDDKKEKLVVITYDKKIKSFLEYNNIYYDKTIYQQIYK